MPLQLIEKRRTTRDDKYNWRPFGDDVGFTPHWWSFRSWSQISDPWCLEVQQEGVEVARVQLDNTVGFEHYENTPSLGAKALEIQFIEVATPFRRKGIATEVVQAIAALHPDRTLVAFSEDAEEFWSSLGWSRYDHPEGAQSFRPLFIAPETDSIEPQTPTPENIEAPPNT